MVLLINCWIAICLKSKIFQAVPDPLDKMAKKDLLGHKVYQVASDLLVSVELLELRGRLVQLGTRVHKDFKDHRVPLDLLDHKVHREIMDNQVNKDSLVTQGLQDRVVCNLLLLMHLNYKIR